MKQHIFILCIVAIFTIGMVVRGKSVDKEALEIEYNRGYTYGRFDALQQVYYCAYRAPGVWELIVASTEEVNNLREVDADSLLINCTQR